MTNNVWFITGARRGMGLDIAKAALAAGHKVVATGDYEDQQRSTRSSKASEGC